jgi:hypothetical protein
MLKASLSSDTIFTDVFLPNGTDGHVSVILRTRQKVLQRSCTKSGSGSLPECTIKLFYDRKVKKVMYAECKREFVHLLIGFLTYPLGCVIKNTAKQIAGAAACHLGRSFSNLYTSAATLDAAGFMGRGPVPQIHINRDVAESVPWPV